MANRLEDDARKVRDLLERRLPDKAVEIAEQIVLDSFEKETYAGNANSRKWKGRKKEGRSKRALLVQSGDLKRSLNVYYSAVDNAIIIESDKQVGKWSLAEIHNEGLDPQPQRKFMPEPNDDRFPEWERQVTAWLDKELNAIFS